MAEIRLFSPAKINLFLHILGKRPDGFHELETLMAPIDYGDEVIIRAQIAKATQITLSCSDPSLSVGEDNLAIRAARAFLKRYQQEAEIEIHLEKRLPVGAGLGGGSSNGATVLLGLKALLQPEASTAELAELAAAFGSDTVFFLEQEPARCTGRGEQVEAFPLRREYYGVLVHPGFGVSTPWAYKQYAYQPTQGVQGWATPDGFSLRNDLEPPVFSKYLWLPTAKAWFQAQPEVLDALMSGSGSSVFALVERPDQRQTLAKRFSAEFGDRLFCQPFLICQKPEKLV